MPCRRPNGRTRGADGTSIITGCRSPRPRADQQPTGLRPRAHPGPATGGAHHPRGSKGKRYPGQHGRGLLRRAPPSARPPARTPAERAGRVPDHRARAGSPLAGRAEPGPARAGPPSGWPCPLPGPGQLPAGGRRLVPRPRGVSPVRKWPASRSPEPDGPGGTTRRRAADRGAGQPRASAWSPKHLLKTPPRPWC